MDKHPILVIDSRHTLYDQRKGLNYKYNSTLVNSFQTLKNHQMHLIFCHKNLDKNEYYFAQFQKTFPNVNVHSKQVALQQLSQMYNEEQNNIIIVTHDYIKFAISKQSNFIYFSNVTQNKNKKQALELEFYKTNNQQCHIAHLEQIAQCVNRKNNDSQYSIGYYFYPKKLNEMIKHKLLLNNNKFKYVPIDFRYYNKYQYEMLNGIFHKIMDIKKSNEINLTKDDIEQIKVNYEQFVNQYQIPNFDSVINLKELAQRDILNIHLDQILKSPIYKKVQTNCKYQIKINTPIQIDYDNSDQDSQILQIQGQIKYPLIVKTKYGAYTENCHIMAIVVNEQGLLNLLKLDKFKCQLILQELIKHQGTIYKIYNLGMYQIIQKRRSIPQIELDNFKFEEGYYVFDTQKDLFENVSKCLKSVDNQNHVNEVLEFEQCLKDHLLIIGLLIRDTFKINLFGFDIIGDINTLQFYLIDINHFPGYKNVDKIVDRFEDLFMEYIK